MVYNGLHLLFVHPNSSVTAEKSPSGVRHTFVFLQPKNGGRVMPWSCVGMDGTFSCFRLNSLNGLGFFL